MKEKKNVRHVNKKYVHICFYSPFFFFHLKIKSRIYRVKITEKNEKKKNYFVL